MTEEEAAEKRAAAEAAADQAADVEAAAGSAVAFAAAAIDAVSTLSAAMLPPPYIAPYEEEEEDMQIPTDPDVLKDIVTDELSVLGLAPTPKKME